MKVIGLVSGGKDSVHNLLLCQQHGHEVVALANLMPSEDALDELDSFMYQTVGHQLIGAYAECAGLPVLRRRITGSSLQQDLEYSQTHGDEVEDLLALLAFAKQQFPGIEAVSSGAIASDYQRLRVEHVCSRLGLVSLAFLWMQPQADLLQGMIDAGILAVLVKVAALGLEPARHLGQTLQQMQPLLHRLNRQYGCNICGEGGEYETLTLDSPLFKHGCIVLDSWTVALHSPDQLASVGVLHPTSFHTEPKLSAATDCLSPAGSATTVEGSLPAVQQTAEPSAGTTVRQPEQGPGSPHQAGPAVIEVPSAFRALEPPEPSASLLPVLELENAGARFQDSEGFISAVCAPALASTSGRSAATTEAALHVALESIQRGLRVRGSSLHGAVLTQLYLADMAHFAAVNAGYRRHFPMVKPAARACIQVPLPEHCPLVVHVLVARQGLQGCRVLHVQSISRWAPSCIGPYSQAVATPGLTFFAGQIGLDPPTMALLPSLQQQVRQCFSGCQAVSTAMRSHLASNLLAVTLYSVPEAGMEARIALQAAVTDLLHHNAEAEAAEDEEQGDAYLSVPRRARPWLPLTTYLVVPALPRGAAVEVQPLTLSAMARDADDASEAEDDADGPHRHTGYEAMQVEHSTQQTAEGMVQCSALNSPGRLCCCQVSLLSSDQQDSRSQELPMGEEHLRASIQCILQLMWKCLKEAELSMRDGASLQMYYCKGAVSKDEERRLVDSVLQAELGSTWPEQQCAASVIPTLAVGPSPAAAAMLHLEILAQARV